MHLGIIPDGNRRWASSMHTSLNHAYAIGFCNVIDITLQAEELGLTQITFFGLSKDNYTRRPNKQVDAIFGQIADSLEVASSLLRESGITIRFYGALEQLRSSQVESLTIIERKTLIKNSLVYVNILVNYSPEWDLFTDSSVHKTHAIPSCDLIFRSGNVERLSGFLPLQSANANLCFSQDLWPDVRPQAIRKAINNYRRLHRPFGQ